MQTLPKNDLRVTSTASEITLECLLHLYERWLNNTMNYWNHLFSFEE